MPRRPGRHFLQIPGPTNVPDRILRAIDRPVLDHRGPEFQDLARRTLAKAKPVFGTGGPVAVYPSSGTGAWEAALVNALSPGDRVLMYETGQFATLWRDLAARIGLEPELLPGDWRGGARADRIEERLAADRGHAIAAVCVVHSETSTGALTDIPAVRAAIDRAGHPALLLVDTVSSLGCAEYRHDDWGVDVTVAGSQKGLMLPPGLGFNAIGPRALEAARTARTARSYWDWGPQVAANETGGFPYTPATNLLYGLSEACDMLAEEGLERVFARHRRLGAAAVAAVEAWGLDIQCADPAERFPGLTGVVMPEGHDADAARAEILRRYDVSLGAGLGRIAGRAFRIGHMGDFNEPMLMGTLACVEMGLAAAGVPHSPGGARAAMDSLLASG